MGSFFTVDQYWELIPSSSIDLPFVVSSVQGGPSHPQSLALERRQTRQSHTGSWNTSGTQCATRSDCIFLISSDFGCLHHRRSREPSSDVWGCMTRRQTWELQQSNIGELVMVEHTWLVTFSVPPLFGPPCPFKIHHLGYTQWTNPEAPQWPNKLNHASPSPSIYPSTVPDGWTRPAGQGPKARPRMDSQLLRSLLAGNMFPGNVDATLEGKDK